jgi:hypothetical protein
LATFVVLLSVFEAGESLFSDLVVRDLGSDPAGVDAHPEDA